MERTKQYEQLALVLREQNDVLTMDEALTWVEVLWEDFETTLARAGEKYPGEATVERYVRSQIAASGSHLHLYQTTNEKFMHLMRERGRH